MGIDLSNYVRVTNTHPETVKSRFAGEDYLFKPNKPEDVHVDAARHIFGFGLEDKTGVMARLGLAQSSDQIEEGTKFLAGIRFEPVVIVQPEISGDGTLSSPDGETPDGSQAPSGDDSDDEDEMPEEEVVTQRATLHRRR
jgi:hypothetical protein